MRLINGYKNPFRVEDLRNQLAHKRKYSELLKTYSSKLPEVPNNNTKTFWDKKIVTEGAALENSGVYQDKLNIITKYLSNKRGKLLDVGFGWGNLERKIQNYHRLSIAGIDISKEAVEAARENLRGEYKEASIFKIPFKSGEFSFVLMLDVIEHICPSKVFRAYKEIDRVLNKRGILIISVPINEGLEETVNEGHNPGGHLRVYTEELLKGELKIAGFRVFKVIYRTAFHRFYKFKTILINIIPFGFRMPNQMIIFARRYEN